MSDPARTPSAQRPGSLDARSDAVPARDVTTLSARQRRNWIRRQGQLARAIEAAQRRSARRFFAATRARRPAARRAQFLLLDDGVPDALGRELRR